MRFHLGRAFQVAMGIMSILLGVYFFRHERNEMHGIVLSIGDARPGWVAVGLVLTVMYVLLQAAMYVYCFRAVGGRIGWGEAVNLFLRRNLASVFLPAGGFTSLGLFTRGLEERGERPTVIHFASTIYAIAGLVTVVVVAVPVLGYLFLMHGLSSDVAVAFIALVLLIAGLLWLVRSLTHQGWAARWAAKLDPSLGAVLEEMGQGHVKRGEVLKTLLASLAIEVVGMLHLYVAMQALGLGSHWELAAVGYVVAVLLLVASPFLRGLGAIEVSMTAVLVRYGMQEAQALGAVLLFRLFEFWLPLVWSLFSFIRGRNSLALRLLPAVMALVLGVVNIASAANPAAAHRMRVLHGLVPSATLDASSLTILIAGLLLLFISIALVRGLRLAWWFALLLALASMAGHLGKAFDMKGAALAFAMVMVLIYTRSQYRLKSDRRKRYTGITVLAATFGGVLIFGILGFYFLDRRDFNIDFTFRESVTNTLKVFFLFGQDGLVAHTHFANEFIVSLRIAFACVITFGLYSLLRPWAAASTESAENERATELLHKWGDSPLDHFKVAADKQLYLPEARDGFVSYATAKGYAIALDMPTAASAPEREMLVRSFDAHCRENNLRPVYYRVGTADAASLKAMGKKVLPIGQEAVLDLGSFNLAGKDQKTLRNSLSRAEREGLVLVTYPPPVSEGVLQKLKSVSAEWLSNGKQEAGFSQGVFDEALLRKDTILTVENAGGRVLAFTNIIPDGVPGEATYDLLRTVGDAPGYVTDFLMVKLFAHFKAEGYMHVNLGLVPMSGITQAKDLPERALKFAYERIARFSHYKGLRSFKEKFGPAWNDKFLAYDHDLDLFFIPAALLEVEEA
ncbi:MAG: phosphatidylglycerol lysyltransferase domain-containing protein [Flavobacteriales bacterium]